MKETNLEKKDQLPEGTPQPEEGNPKPEGRGKDKDKRGKGKRSGKKGGGGRTPVEPKHNDYRFYAATEQIAKDIASIAWNYLGGTPYAVSGRNLTQGVGNVFVNNTSIPAVMRINYIPSIGVTTSKTQGANMAAIQLYTFVRQRNSGASNYEAADLLMYILALKDIYAEVARCKKILGLAPRYDYYNHNLPDLVLLAEGVDAVDLRTNYAQYRARLNLLISKATAFALPKYFKIVERATFIESCVFQDSSSIKGQFYTFHKMGYYVWSTTTSTQGTELIFKESSNNGSPFSDYLDQLEEMLDAMYLDTDALLMSGDILKAFGESQLYTLSEVEASYTTPFGKDEDILAQIENSTALFNNNNGVISFAEFGNTLNITQSNQLISWQPTMTVAKTDYAGILETLPFNSHKDDPDYRDVLEWTRLMCTYSLVAGENNTYIIALTSCGLELVLSYDIFAYRSGKATRITSFGSNLGVSSGTYAQSLLTAVYVSNFDWHPILYMVDNTYSAYIPLFGDFKNSTTIAPEVLKRINDAAVYGALFDATLYSKAQR